MDKILVLCPFCDREQRVHEEKPVVSCERCGKPFNNDLSAGKHPEEFWSNPDTSARF
jgi:uncharacterized CHY-type Zn-finger protein